MIVPCRLPMLFNIHDACGVCLGVHHYTTSATLWIDLRPPPHIVLKFCFYKFHIVKNVKIIELILIIIITCRLANTRQIEQINFSTTEVCMGPRQNQNGHFNTKLCVCVGGGVQVVWREVVNMLASFS